MATQLSTSREEGNDVSVCHPLYTAAITQINLVNDVYNGIDTAKEHIFQFPQEALDTYNERKDKATLRNFVKRAVDAFTGMIFRKPIELSNYGPKVMSISKTIDTKIPLSLFAKKITNSLIRDGKTYILIDSGSDATESNVPYMIPIERRQLINWRKDAKGKYSLIVIEELIEEQYGLFGTKYIKQWRVYTADGTITLWRSKDAVNSNNSSVAQVQLQLNSTAATIIKTIPTELGYIPFVEIELDDVPVLYDIAKMNIKHLNRQSHKDRYLTMAALPIPIIWGAEVNDAGQTVTAKPALVIGVDEAFIFQGSKDECDMQWRELTGTSIALLEDDLNSIVEDITTGVLRAAESNNAVQKTASEIQLLQAEASNRITVMSTIVEQGFKEAFTILADFCNEAVPSNATFLINKDFNASLMGSDGARVVMESYLAGLISTETYLQTLANMEIIDIGSAADELIRISKDTFVPKPRIAPKGTDGITDKIVKKPKSKIDNKIKKNIPTV